MIPSSIVHILLRTYFLGPVVRFLCRPVSDVGFFCKVLVGLWLAHHAEHGDGAWRPPT